MQTISCYASAASTVGVWRDAANAKTVAAPTLVLGVEACLKLRLWERTDDLTPYPIDRFAAVAAWRFDIDADFNGATVAKIAADHEHITVETVTERIPAGTDDEGEPVYEEQEYSTTTTGLLQQLVVEAGFDGLLPDAALLQNLP